MSDPTRMPPKLTDRTLPWWLRLILAVTGLMRLGFGLTLLGDPAAIVELWPWPMTSLAARLLGASTLVSAPLALLSAVFNRWRMARIPIVMMLTYRVLQLVAGLIHVERFDFAEPVTWNYFAGGGFMLLVLLFALVRGHALGEPAPEYAAPDRLTAWLRTSGRSVQMWLAPARLRIGRLAASGIQSVAITFFALGVLFMVLGTEAAPAWIEAHGQLTPLTARLFASPMIGLALGLWLIRAADRWHEVLVPALGISTFGLAGLITLLVESASVAPPSPAGWIIAAAPALLLAVGVYLLVGGRGASSADSADSALEVTR